MSETLALAYAKLFNSHISLIIENALQAFGKEQVKGLLYASTGAQIDGSWRNAIGDEAERVVQTLLIKEAIERSQLRAFILREQDGVEELDPENDAEQVERIREFRGFTLRNGMSLIFSSESDISIIDTDGTTKAVIEVKGGADPAGALERYWAVKKSFEEARRENEEVTTIFVASCITSEVNTRIENDSIFDQYFNLTEIITKEDKKEEFLDYIFTDILRL